MAKKLPEFDIDYICNQLVDGNTLISIAKYYSCAYHTLHNYINADNDRSARCTRARIESARAVEELATEMLMSATDNFEVNKANAIASFSKWRLSKINPAMYGEKVTHEMLGHVDNAITITFVKSDDALLSKPLDITTSTLVGGNNKVLVNKDDNEHE